MPRRDIEISLRIERYSGGVQNASGEGANLVLGINLKNGNRGLLSALPRKCDVNIAFAVDHWAGNRIHVLGNRNAYRQWHGVAGVSVNAQLNIAGNRAVGNMQQHLRAAAHPDRRRVLSDGGRGLAVSFGRQFAAVYFHFAAGQRCQGSDGGDVRGGIGGVNSKFHVRRAPARWNGFDQQ